MSKRTKQKLINGCMAAAFVVSSTLTPMIANAATPEGVTRIGGYDQYATAALMAQSGWTGTSDSVVLSAGLNYALVDALAAGPLAAKLKAPIVLTDNGPTLNVSAKAELLRLKPKKVYITSGTAVIKQSVVDEITAMGITPVQLGGYDQYETSVNIAKEMANQGVDITKVMLAAGWLTPADALSVAPIAAAQGIPILTTTKDQIPASVKTYLDSIATKVTDSYVVGGTAVVSDTVKGQLKGNVTRYFGQTKYDTNVQILKGFAKEYRNAKVFVANGETLVDALAVVPLAAASQSPVVLVHQQLDNSTKDFVKLNMSTDDMVAVGGEAVVPTAGMNALMSNVSYATDSAKVGSTDPTKPLELTDNVKITGNNVTLENATLNYSVYVKGNNINLKNLTVKGTVFVDPGETGSATIDGVTAANIVILSGASQSVNITRSTVTGKITISSKGNTNVVFTSVTSNGVTIQTHEIFEKGIKVGTISITSGAGNSLGEMTITSELGQTTEVNLSGAFTQPINVVGQGGVSINAAAGSVISQITTSAESLTLDGKGTYTAVAANGDVTLAKKTTVTTMTTTGNVKITVPKGASIGTLDSTGPAPSVGGGGDVNGEATGGGTGGGGGGDTGGGDTGGTTTAPTIESIPGSLTVNGTDITITPSFTNLQNLNIKVSEGSTMDIIVTRAGTRYNLGSWTLASGSAGNQIFSASNARNLNILQTLESLKATGIQSSEIFAAVNFHGLLTQAQTMAPADKAIVYESMASIFEEASLSSSFYQALNLPGIYAVAGPVTQPLIHSIVSAAKPSGVSGTGDAFAHAMCTDAEALGNMSEADRNEFFANIDFKTFFDALSSSTNKEAIYSAINFTALYNGLAVLPTANKLQVYVEVLKLYQAALTLNTSGGNIDYGAILALVMTNGNTVTMPLTNANGTTTYTLH